MSSENLLAQHIETIVVSLLKTIDSNHKQNEWLHATYSEVHSKDGNSSMLKMRIQLASLNIDASTSPEPDIRDLVADTWEGMFKQSKDIWYGFKLTVYPDGQHKIEYNYDPNCIDDPSFIDF